MNARSRDKTGLPAWEGDEDLIDYYYCVMHPQTESGRERRRTDAKRVRKEVIPRLLGIYGHIPLPDKYLPEGYERPPAPEPPNLKM